MSYFKVPEFMNIFGTHGAGILMAFIFGFLWRSDLSRPNGVDFARSDKKLVLELFFGYFLCVTVGYYFSGSVGSNDSLVKVYLLLLYTLINFVNVFVVGDFIFNGCFCSNQNISLTKLASVIFFILSISIIYSVLFVLLFFSFDIDLIVIRFVFYDLSYFICISFSFYLSVFLNHKLVMFMTSMSSSIKDRPYFK
ncbi:hypothetical protein L4D13_01120 [Photobacterium profundum]|uniref:hypothetical protein n=1 Tax=Photobacterium profundum TaxID=74109 RepID=UPI003D0C35AC